MTRSWCDWRWQLKLLSWVTFVGVVAGGDRTLAQVTADPSLGTTVTVNGDTFEITNGTTVGDKNLFHSFSNFSIPDGGTAHFVNAPTVANILARVTGGNASDIQGLIQAQGSADLFLMNPNGILFGPNAQLDLGGSFVATTANAIQFPGGAEFAQNSPVAANNSLLSVNPSAFLFNQIAAQPIINRALPGLQIPDGKGLLLLGGNVSLEGGRLFAPGGRVELGGVAGAGTVELNVDSSNLLLSYPTQVQRADVSLTNEAEVYVRSGSGGSIAINTRNLNMSGASRLRAGIGLELGSPDSKAGNIEINATGGIEFTDGSLVSNSTFGQGNAGNVTITASDNISLDGESSDGFLSGIFSVVTQTAKGNGGNINVMADSLSVTNGAQLAASTSGQGDAGNVTITASEISFDGRDTTVFFSSGAFSTVEAEAVGKGGNIDVTADSLSVTNGARLVANTFGQGDAGNVTITARDAVTIDAKDSGNPTNINSIVSIDAVGNGGNITIKARSLLLIDGGELFASTYGQGDAGSIQVNATEFVSISGIDSANGYSSGLFASTEDSSTGTGGDIVVNTNKFYISDGAAVDARTSSTSNGGRITVNANTLEILNGGQFFTTATNSGRAGDITVNVTDNITFSGSDPTFTARREQFGEFAVTNTGSASGVFANTTVASCGSGGSIKIDATTLNLTDAAQISAQSQGIGRAGTLKVNATGELNANNGEITTAATQSGGGDITIAASNIRLHGDSDIRTDLTSSAGSGGNINLTADSIIAFDDSDILAFAAEGQGGNITLNTPIFFGSSYRPGNLGTDYTILDGNNRVDVNASGAIASGNITTPDTTFVQNSLTELPENVVDTGTLVANSCIARGSDRSTGSFIITGTGGLPTRPGDNTASSYPTGTVRSTSNRATDAIRSWKIGDPIVEPQGAYRLPNGQLVLSRECS